MTNDNENTNFWGKLPGILTGIAAVITAIAAIITAIQLLGSKDSKQPNEECQKDESCYQEGLALNKNREWDKAIKDFDRAIIKYKYTYAEVYYNRGLAYKALAYQNKDKYCNLAKKDFELAMTSNHKEPETVPSLNDQIKKGRQDLHDVCPKD